MSFWNMSDGNSAISGDSEFDAGGSMEPIPDGTSVLAMPDEAKWAEDKQGNEYLSIRWNVLKPAAYQGRKIFHKLWISDEKPNQKDPVKYRDKQLRMFGAIDHNAGGKLGKQPGKPTDDQLSVALINKQMVLRLGVWAMDGDNGPMTGNWVSAVSDKTKPISEAAAPAKKPQTKAAFDDDLDDDVPW